MKIRDIAAAIEGFAPLALQESKDNSGLVVGRYYDEVPKALLAVDVTEEVLDEAEAEGCDIVITHHPLVFHAMKRFNSADTTQRCVERAIRRGIALYACHTNLDSTLGGMSWVLGGKLGLLEMQPLQPTVDGAGFGVVGRLAAESDTAEYLRRVKSTLGCKCIRHSDIATPTVSRVALCTGSGASMIREAIAAGAELYITADMKYNDFIDPRGAVTVADVGHFESEFCAIDILFGILSKNLCTFAVRKSERSRNPVNYLV